MATGCASEAVRATEGELVGRWRGDPVAPPERVWWSAASFDVSFSENGDFSAVASTFSGGKHDLHFRSGYRVTEAHTVRIADGDLGGEWRLERTAPGEIKLFRGDMTLALRKRYGS